MLRPYQAGARGAGESPGADAGGGIAIAFDGRLTDKRRERIRQVLATLVTTGAARTAGAAYFVPR